MLRSTITAVAVLDRAPDRDRLRDLVDRGTRLVPRMRQRVRGNPLSIAPPRWEVDPNFDLDFHLRFVRAGGDGATCARVLDLAEPIAMQGFDRARPLWEFTVVEGLEDDRRRHHHEGPPRHHRRRRRGEDRAGDVRARAATRPGRRHARRARGRGDGPARPVRGTPSTTSGAATSASPSARPAPCAGGRRGRGRRPGRHRRAGRRDGRVGRPPGRPGHRAAVAAHDRPLAVGPLRHARRSPMADAKAAAKPAGGTLNDAFVAATAGGFPATTRRSGSRADRAAHDDADQRPHRRRPPTSPATSSCPPASRSRSTSTTRPSACGPSTTSSPRSGASRRWRSSSRWPGCSTGCPPR